MRALDLTGQRFGRLIVEGMAPRRSHMIEWRCQCDCGGTTVTQGAMLKIGRTKSCGCWRRERMSGLGTAKKTHGESARGHTTTEYEIWRGMKARCRYPRHVGYVHYGGRGIRVCDRWRDSYEAFLADMGRRPSPTHSLDRINNNGPYSPENCRWATTSEQARDKDFSTLGRKGGAVRWAAMTTAERAALLSKANTARLAKQTPEQRRALAAHALRARWAKHRSVAAS